MKKGLSVSVLIAGILTVLSGAATIVLGAIGLAISERHYHEY